jgi:hypothetical protein
MPRCPAFSLIILVACAFSLNAFGAPSDNTADAAIRAEYNAIAALRKAKPPAELESDQVARLDWRRRRNIELHERGLAFYTRNSMHPLRWDVLVLLPYGRDFRETVYRSGFRQLVPDPTSLAAWEAEYYPKLRLLLAAPDASVEAQREARRLLIEHTSLHGLSHPTETEACLTLIRD